MAELKGWLKLLHEKNMLNENYSKSYLSGKKLLDYHENKCDECHRRTTPYLGFAICPAGHSRFLQRKD